MIGSQDRWQEDLFVAGPLSQLIPEDHILKQVDKILDLSWLRDEVADTYSQTMGRPRRVSKTHYASFTTHHYLYDGDQIIADYNEAGVWKRRYYYGPGIDEPICMVRYPGLTTFVNYYYYDGLGSVTAMSDYAGRIVEKYSYDVFGEPKITDQTGVPRSASAYSNRYLFTGREFESENGLYYYRARYYSPKIGRFMQTDPIGHEDGLNLYTYVKNNPVNWIDPSGLKLKPARPSPGCIACMASVALACGVLCGSDPVWDCPGDTWSDCMNKCMSTVFDPRKSFGTDGNIIIGGVVIGCVAACIIGI